MSADAARLLRLFRTLYWVMVSVVAALGAAIAYTSSGEPSGGHVDVSDSVVAFAAIALALTCAIPLWRWWRLRPRAARTGAISDREAIEALARCATAYLVSWSMCEAIAVLGFGLSLLSGDPRYFLAFGAGSLVNFGIYMPRAAAVKRHLSGLLGT